MRKEWPVIFLVGGDKKKTSVVIDGGQFDI